MRDELMDYIEATVTPASIGESVLPEMIEEYNLRIQFAYNQESLILWGEAINRVTPDSVFA